MLVHVVDDLFSEHRPPRAHPERPERLRAVATALTAAGLERESEALPVRRAGEDELGRVHTAGYLAELTRTVPGQSGWLDEDTYFSPGTWEAALSAAGAAVDVTAALLEGRARRGLALVRPPGHHAEADRAMGFCLLNNVAVAAAAARAAGAARVSILDWDVHHGNGTQHVFYGDGSVQYLSTHQFPFYPGTGAADEVGAGDGLGATVNVPLPAGCGDAEYLAAFDRVIVPELRRFRPDLVLVSAGFDAFAADPLAAMRLSAAGFRALADRVVRVADEVASGRLALVLEGGYDLGGLGGSMAAVFDVLVRGAAAEEPAATGAPAEAAIAAIEGSRRALSACRGEGS